MEGRNALGRKVEDRKGDSRSGFLKNLFRAIKDT